MNVEYRLTLNKRIGGRSHEYSTEIWVRVTVAAWIYPEYIGAGISIFPYCLPAPRLEWQLNICSYFLIEHKYLSQETLNLVPNGSLDKKNG